MRRFRLAIVAIVIASSVVEGAGPTAASAETLPRPEGVPDTEFEQYVEQFLRENPNPPRTAEGLIQLEPGVALIEPMDDGHPPVATVCTNYHLCLWEHAGYRGYGISLWTCATRDLGRWGLRNRTSSLKNAQTGGTVSYFYDDDSHVSYVGSDTARSHRNNFQFDVAYDGRSWNDRIDFVDVC
jgi:hypothetical protein